MAGQEAVVAKEQPVEVSLACPCHEKQHTLPRKHRPRPFLEGLLLRGDGLETFSGSLRRLSVAAGWLAGVWERIQLAHVEGERDRSGAVFGQDRGAASRKREAWVKGKRWVHTDRTGGGRAFLAERYFFSAGQYFSRTC